MGDHIVKQHPDPRIITALMETAVEVSRLAMNIGGINQNFFDSLKRIHSSHCHFAIIHFHISELPLQSLVSNRPLRNIRRSLQNVVS